MKLSFTDIFRIFKKKAINGIDKMIDTKTKLQFIKDHYDEEVRKYVKSCENILLSEEELKEKVYDLTEKSNELKSKYEHYIKIDDLVKAKATFIRYKGCKEALDMTIAAYDNVATQCEQVRDSLNKVDENKEILASKIDYLNSKIEAIKLSSAAGPIKFSIDCDTMLKEVEDEIQLNQYRLEAKQEVSKILQHDNTIEATDEVSGVDAEFDEIVRNFKK